MSSLADHQSRSVTKLMSIGDPMSGKTGSLVSLVAAGYKLRILDLDNKLDILKQAVLRTCPEMIGNVEFRPVRDKRKSSALGPVIIGKPQAYRTVLNMIDEWKYTDEHTGEVTDLGRPDEWGPDCILVIDSLSRWCDSAYDHWEPLVPRGSKGEYDPRAVYGNAQDGIETSLAHITSDSYRTNLIVIAHVQYLEMPDKSTKGFPQGVGKALSPKIAQYFPSMVLLTNKNNKRVIRTNSSPLIDLANSAPFDMSPEYSLETGMAEIFEVLRKAPAQKQPTPVVVPKRPQAVTLRRMGSA